MTKRFLGTQAAVVMITIAVLCGCTTPKGDFQLDLDQAAFIAETGFRALDYKAEAAKQAEEAQHAKLGWLRAWSEAQQTRKERLAKEQYDRIRDDLPEFIELWKRVEDELAAIDGAEAR